jgi:cytochrome P450
MTTDYETEAQPITQEEIEAVKARLLETVNIDELKTKNSAVLTVMMPLPLRVLIDQAADAEAGGEGKGSAADWARRVFADALGYNLPVKSETKVKKNKRDAEVQQRAQRAMVADLIEKARRGEIDLD